MEEEREEAQPLLLLTLFDLYWFHHSILLRDPPPISPPPPPSPTPPPTSSPPTPPPDQEEFISTPSVRRHRRSLSDELPPSVAHGINPPPPKLQTILSGKEGVMGEDVARAGDEITQKAERYGRQSQEDMERRRRKRRQESKSLSDLEFEELRGLMELGFDFSDAEADPRLMSIVPALRRRSRPAGQGDLDSKASPPASDEAENAAVSRPYLSEAWDAEEDDPLRNWRIPVAAAGVDMRDHLKLWAHVVASTVR